MFKKYKKYDHNAHNFFSCKMVLSVMCKQFLSLRGSDFLSNTSEISHNLPQKIVIGTQGYNTCNISYF